MLSDSISGTFTDLWSLGVIIYQMLAGKTPWTKGAELVVFEQICNCKYTFPDHFSDSAKDLISKLLTKNPI
jgi:serine/threonine protein kinase